MGMHVRVAEAARNDKGEVFEYGINKSIKSNGLERDAIRNEATQAKDVLSLAHATLCCPGQPLDAATRAFMEPRFGYDFSKVRVHTDEKAAESARRISAQAYTVGPNVVFDASKLAPNSKAGQRVLAHELTHVIQQSKKGISSLPVLIENPSREREANSTADAIMSGRRVELSCLSPASGLQRTAQLAPESASALLETNNKELEDLKTYRRTIKARIVSGKERIKDLESQRSGVLGKMIGVTVSAFGLTSLPSLDWVEPEGFLENADRCIKNGDAIFGRMWLDRAMTSTSERWSHINEFSGKSEQGATRAVDTLRFVQQASTKTFSVAANVATGGSPLASVLDTANRAAQNMAGQLMESAIGTRKDVDWQGLGTEAAVTLVVNLLINNIAKGTIDKIASNSARALMWKIEGLRKVPFEPGLRDIYLKRFEDSVKGVISGRSKASLRALSPLVQQIIKNAGSKKKSAADIVEEAIGQLLDPTGLRLDWLFGAGLGDFKQYFKAN